MNKTLRDDDARAVDLLLDRSQVAGMAGPAFVQATPAQEHVQGVEQVLGLLRMLPDAEPPQDLVARTLRFVDESADGAALRNAASFAAHLPHPHA